MITVGEIFAYLEEKAPFQLQCDWDNSGLLVGRTDAEVSKVLVALDITQPVVQEAVMQGVQLIVAHHPVIFGRAKSVTDQTAAGQVVLTLAEHHIAAICAHTNLDAVEGGVNDVLALKLGLTGIGQLHQDGLDNRGRPVGIGRVGYVPEQSLYDFALAVKGLLGANGLRLVEGNRPVYKVAVGGGACAGMMDKVLAQGCDTFVTADVKYHDFLDAKAEGLNLIDAGHFPTENMVCSVLKDWLVQRFSQLTVNLSTQHQEVLSYL